VTDTGKLDLQIPRDRQASWACRKVLAFTAG
jgi:hypothetical protein